MEPAILRRHVAMVGQNGQEGLRWRSFDCIRQPYRNRPLIFRHWPFKHFAKVDVSPEVNPQLLTVSKKCKYLKIQCYKCLDQTSLIIFKGFEFPPLFLIEARWFYSHSIMLAISHLPNTQN